MSRFKVQLANLKQMTAALIFAASTCFGADVIEIYKGNAPVIDGLITPGEYDDAVEFGSTHKWKSHFNAVEDCNDLSIKCWAKHDGNDLYFAFDVTDDVLYGINTDRWLPEDYPEAHELSQKGLPWFGDAIELMINAGQEPSVRQGQRNHGDGRSWQMVCNLSKSRIGGIGKGGLMEGEERVIPESWRNYQGWILSGAMKAAVKPKQSGKGYVIEWSVRGNPCLELGNGKFWGSSSQDVSVGFNAAIQDLDQKNRGKGNWGNFNHEQWFAGEKGRETQLRQWGTMVIHQYSKPIKVHVASNGKDDGDGSKKRPFKSIALAQAHIRQLKQEGTVKYPVCVELAAGVYELDEPLSFGPADSGTDECPVIYKSGQSKKAVLSGGRTITGFRKGKDGVWSADVQDVNTGNWYFEQLFINGTRAQRARIPASFYHYITRKVSDLKPGCSKNDAFVAEHNDVVLLRSLDNRKLKDVTVVAYHSWTISRYRIASIDPNLDIVYLTGPAGRPFCEGPSQRYHLENIEQGLANPGQWYLDRRGKVLYRPYADEDMNKTVVIAPVLNRLIEIKGDPCGTGFVTNIAFEGIGLEYANYLLPDVGFGDTQAATGQSLYGANAVDAVVMVDGGRKIKLTNCEIAHIGTCGIWMRDACRDCEVTHCYIHDFGATGVRVGGASGASQTGQIKLTNNIIRTGGRIHMGGVGVLIGGSGDNEIQHNDISDMFYTGVSVGWKWDYGVSPAVRNRVEYNHIHHIGQGVLSDMGGVYTLGESAGTVIRNNTIHDVYSYDYYGRGGWGIYNDQASSSILVENNLIYNTKTGAYSLHYGNDLVIRNNIFAFAMDGQLQRVPAGIWQRAVQGRIWFENNIIYWDRGGLFYGDDWNSWDDSRIVSQDNIYWNAAGPVTFENGMLLSEWQNRGHETGSVIQDPCFIDAAHSDFRFSPGSAALARGFKPFDSTLAGVYGTQEWIELAFNFEYKPIEFAPEPAVCWLPRQIDEDFEAIAPGKLPANAKAALEGAGETVGVCEIDGNRCLRMADALGLAFTSNPALYYNTCFASGITKVSFDVKLEKGADFEHELRDVIRGYIGPKFRISNGTLIVNGRELMQVAINEWVSFEVSVTQDRRNNGWDLQVKSPKTDARLFKGLAVRSPEWERTTQVGFLSTAARAAEFYLDNIKILNSDCKRQQHEKTLF